MTRAFKVVAVWVVVLIVGVALLVRAMAYADVQRDARASVRALGMEEPSPVRVRVEGASYAYTVPALILAAAVVGGALIKRGSHVG